MREKWKTPQMSAALSALVLGTVVHLFGLLMPMHNCDDVAQMPGGYGTGISSGRWLLSVLGDLMERLDFHYNLPLLNGLLFLGLIGVAAWLMVEVFAIQSRLQAGLIGTMMVVFPSVFSTMIFHYTVVYYGLSIILAVLAGWFLERKRHGWLWAIVCVACSLGIYQGYVPLTITIMLLRFLQKTLKSDSDWKSLLIWGLRCCGVLLAGVGLYFLLLKGMLLVYNTQLSTYKGTDQMGKIDPNALPALIKMAYYTFLRMPQRDFWSLASSPVLGWGYCLTWLLTAVLVVRHLWCGHRKWQIWLLAGLACLLLPLAVNFILIMCPEGDIYTLMVYSWLLVPCVPVILLLDETAVWLRKTAVVLLAVFCFTYGYHTNVNYTALYYLNRQVENQVASIITQVRMTEGFDTEKKWVFLGTMDDPLLRSPWRFALSYGGVEDAYYLLRRPTWTYWIWDYYGYMPPMAGEEESNALAALDEVQEMPCWPNQGSIRVIDDAIVVKFSQTNEE